MPGMNMPRVVVDTNVLVSALIGKRLRRLIELLAQNRFILVFSKETYDELFYVLARPKFKKYFSSSEFSQFRELLSLHSIFVHPAQTYHDCRDLKDNKFLECAMVFPVEYIVSGDEDLLVLHPYNSIPVISPYDFIQMLLVHDS